MTHSVLPACAPPPASTEGYLERLRGAELEAVREWFSPGARVLEIGGGSGYQAGVISSWGCQVISLDLPPLAPRPVSYFPVQSYDGVRVPFPDDSFDVVFSSNVLEHVPPAELPALLGELRRVVKKGRGRLIHVLPTTAWRFWTMLGHYPYLLKKLCGRLRAPRGSGSRLTTGQERKPDLSYLARHVWFVGPHGEYPHAWSELYYFSRSRWRRVFEDERFEVLGVSSNRLFYTGYGLLPGAPRNLRRVLARLLRPSCRVYVLAAG
jgi:SAM-dependent methyltransferase